MRRSFRLVSCFLTSSPFLQKDERSYATFATLLSSTSLRFLSFGLSQSVPLINCIYVTVIILASAQDNHHTVVWHMLSRTFTIRLIHPSTTQSDFM